MSSHREAPEISKDPVADSTDVYAFVSPDRPDTVTIITNYIPFEGPAGGPNFYEFGDDVLYRIHISNHPPDIELDEQGDIIFEFRFTTEVTNPNSFLYNTGPITSLDSPNWNRRQTYTVVRANEHEEPVVLATGLACPPCNIGPRSTPDYADLATAAIHDLPGRRQGVRRAAPRRVLGRSGLDLRPRHAPPVPEPAPDPVGGGRRRERARRRSACTRSRSRCRSPRSPVTAW